MSFISISPDSVKESAISDLILYVSKTKYEDDWPSLPHLHHFTEIMLITEGEGNFVSNEKFFPIKKGCLIIIENGFMHTEISSKDNVLSYYSLGLKDTVFKKVKKENFIYEIYENYNKLFYWFEAIFDELRKKEKGYDIVIQNSINSVLILIERITLSVAEKSEYFGKTSIKNLLEYIDSNYNDDITLEKLCEIAFVSKPHLIRLFKESTGNTPMDYLLKRRLTAAKTLLITTELSISDIAMMLNFPSVSSFIQKFKLFIEATPLKFRKFY